MIVRIAEEKIKDILKRKKIVTLIGPRQVGKSTLASVLASEANKVLELNGDNSDIQTMFEDINEVKLKLLLGNCDFVLVDEAQKIRNLGNFLKLIDDNHKDIKVIVTGSSSFHITKIVNESLSGRKRELRLYPLSFSEMVKHTNLIEETRMIDYRLVYGYYPELVTNSGEAKEILKELIDSYLYKDALEDNDIAKPDKLVKLVQALAFQIGNTVSYNELSNLLKIDIKTVERYIQILEKNYIIYTLPSYSTNERNELKYSRKLYFWDLGIRNAVIGNMAPIEMRSQEELGHLWENFLITERIKRNDYMGRSFVKHYFWRNQQKKEIDLIEIEDGKISAFEIKRKVGKTIKVPKQFADTYPTASFSCITPSEVAEFLLGE